MPLHPKFTRTALLIGGVTLTLGLAACSNGNGPAKSTATTAAPNSSSTTTVPGDTPAPFNKAKNAHDEVKTTGPCTQTGGAWVLKGTVTNTTSASTGYSIVVDYVQVPGNTVLDTEIVKVASVAPKQTVPWQSSWTYANNDVTCVVRQSQRTG